MTTISIKNRLKKSLPTDILVQNLGRLRKWAKNHKPFQDGGCYKYVKKDICLRRLIILKTKHSK